MSQTINIKDELLVLEVDPGRVRLLRPGQPFDATTLSVAQLTALATALAPYLSGAPAPSLSFNLASNSQYLGTSW